MTDSHLYRPEDFVRLRWKNGLGYTTELLKANIDKKTFAWRLSIAQVTEDGPFSNFEGYQRTLLLLNGRGITLQHGDGSHQVLNQIFDAAHFSGKGPTLATLHDGPIEDFNIMTRTGICSALIHAGDGAKDWLQTTAAASLLLIYAGGDALQVALGGSDLPAIPAGHLLRVEINQALPISITGPGAIAVEIVGTVGRSAAI